MNETLKGYKLVFELRPEYLYAKVQAGAVDQKTAVDYLHEVISKCKKFGHTRLLLERDIPATLAEEQIYFSGTDFAHTGLDEIMIALVDTRPENAEGLELTILVQNNRGANIKLFDNIADAEMWLHKGLPHLVQMERSRGKLVL
jgi:hypothetical protein